MDETSRQDLLTDLRATRAKLDAVLEESAALKVLLALRTHQHDLAWQAARRLEGAAAAATSQMVDPPNGQPEDSEALACAEERLAAAKLVLGAVLDCIGRRALDRRKFKAIIAQAGRDAPDSGPGAARHAVLLAEARRVLGVAG